MMMSDKGDRKMEVISTGSIGLGCGIGSWWVAKEEGSWKYTGRNLPVKTTIATHVIAERTEERWDCAIIDAEHAFDSAYAQRLGVEVDNLLISQPDYGEQALEIADRLILSGALDVVVIGLCCSIGAQG
jgi:recombination protein RecA